MRRRTKKVEATPLPAGLDRCTVEDWVGPDLEFGWYQRDETADGFELMFMREAQRRFGRAQVEAGVRGPGHRPSWRGRPYPRQPGWEPNIEPAPAELAMSGGSRD